MNPTTKLDRLGFGLSIAVALIAAYVAMVVFGVPGI